MTQTVWIDPKDIHNPLTQRIITLFQTYPEKQIFTKHTPYPVGESVFQVTNTILCRRDHEKQFVYQVLSNQKFGDGTAKTTPYLVEHIVTLQADTGAFTCSNPPYPLIAKHQQAKNINERTKDDIINGVNNEYKHAKSNHLAAEEPMIDVVKTVDPANHAISTYEISICSVQRKMPGIELFDFLVLLIENKDSSTTFHFHLMLTLKLLEKFNQQVLQKNLLHGDLKPENIIIDLGEYSACPKTLLRHPEVAQHNHSNALIETKISIDYHIIDYEVAHPFHEERSIVRHTELYTAPSYMNRVRKKATIMPAATNEKEDMYSIAQIIKIIFRIMPDETVPWQNTMGTKNFQREIINRLNTYFSNEPKEFPSLILAPLVAAFANMTHPDPANQWSFNQVLTLFLDIEQKYNQLKTKTTRSLTSSAAERTTDTTPALSDGFVSIVDETAPETIRIKKHDHKLFAHTPPRKTAQVTTTNQCCTMM